MNSYSLILQTATRMLLPLLLLFSVFLLLRGHNEPGGGFIGGLVAAAGFALHLFAYDVPTTRRLLVVDPRVLFGYGLLAAGLSGVLSAFLGQPYFTSQWWTVNVPLLGPLKLSTPLIFDIGVYLVVVGSVMTLVLTLAEAED